MLWEARTGVMRLGILEVHLRYNIRCCFHLTILSLSSIFLCNLFGEWREGLVDSRTCQGHGRSGKQGSRAMLFGCGCTRPMGLFLYTLRPRKVKMICCSTSKRHCAE